MTAGYIIFTATDDSDTPSRQADAPQVAIEKNRAHEISYEDYTPSGKKIVITSPQGHTSGAGDIITKMPIATLYHENKRTIKLTSDKAHYMKEGKKLALKDNVHLNDSTGLKINTPSGILDLENEKITGTQGIEARDNNCSLTGQNYCISKEQSTIDVTGRAKLIIKEKT